MTCPAFDLVSRIEIALEHPPRDAERQVDLVLGLDAAGEDDGLAGGPLLHRQGPNRPNLRLGRRHLLLAASEQRGCCEQDRDKGNHPLA